jgi:hypothetical protein
MAKTLPKTIFVARHREEEPGNSFYVAEARLEEVIEDDGPTVVGEYRLVRAARMEKRAQRVK